MTKKLRILLVEDREADAVLALYQLEKAGLDVDSVRVVTEADFVMELGNSPDVIICDHQLPQFDSFKALDLLNQSGQDIPFIVVSGVIGEEKAIHALKKGAADYLLKDRLVRLGEAVRHAIAEKEIRDQKRRSDNAWRLLAQASAVLNSSLDSRTNFQALAELVVEKVYAQCFVHTYNKNKHLELLAFAESGPPAAGALLKASGTAFDSTKLGDLLHAKEPVVLTKAHGQLVGRLLFGIEGNRLMDELDFPSGVLIPLGTRDHGDLGTITLLNPKGRPSYDEIDMNCARELGHRASMAIENSRLFRAAHDAVQSEQIARLKAEQLYDDAQKANRLKDEFLATVSHELRTPLNAIVGWTDLLANHEIDALELQDVFGVLNRNALSLAHLINDLLDMSRIISGKMRLELKPVLLSALIDETVSSLRFAAEAKMVDISVEIDPSIGLIRADSLRLQQLIWNLVSNAIKFNYREGKVVIKAVKSGDTSIDLTISDTGEGIEPSFQTSLFSLFRQEDATLTRRHGGLGIGLALVRQIIELHGGSVSVESAGKGTGALFKVVIPILHVVPDKSPSPAEVLSFVGDRSAMPLAGLSVLVVDDEADALMLISRVLQASGAEVVVANSANEALLQMQRCWPDVLLSDVGMPEKDGYTLMGEVLALAAACGKNLRAGAISAYAGKIERERALLAGFEIHIAKPIQAAQIVSAVEYLAKRA